MSADPDPKKLFARIVRCQSGPLGSPRAPSTPKMDNFDRISDSAVVEGGNQDYKQPGSSAKRRHDTCTVERDDPSVTCQGDNNQEPKRPRMESSRKQKMVCQYMKHDPAKYSTWRTCPGPGFDGINRLKYVYSFSCHYVFAQTHYTESI